MRLIPSDPDLRTLVARIDEGSIDLQPDFQRGIVWPIVKQQRLIDSILRDWHVPPIHLITDADEHQVVLDGQQRLHAIHEFVHGTYSVDGMIPPADKNIRELHGLTFSQLPKFFRHRLERFTIRVFEIIDYKSEEPYELFYRLNQPTVLTSAEKRNAFFGPAREQVKTLVSEASSFGLSKDIVGFSNSRMAYDDTVARFCLTLEMRRLDRKVASADITEKYRSGEPFSEEVFHRARSALRMLLDQPALQRGGIRFNKATFHSWLCMIAREQREKVEAFGESLGSFVIVFEQLRGGIRQSFTSPVITTDIYQDLAVVHKLAPLIVIFNDRATSRVGDVASVLLRDLVLWISFFVINNLVELPPRFQEITNLLHAVKSGVKEAQLLDFIDSTSWGKEL